MKFEGRRERLEDNSFGNYIDIWVSSKSREELDKFDAQFEFMGYCNDEVSTEGDIVTYHYSITTFHCSSIQAARSDYKFAIQRMKDLSSD